MHSIDKMVKTTTVVQGRNWKDSLEHFLLSYRATLSHFDQFLVSKTSIQQRAQNCVTVTAAQKCQPFSDHQRIGPCASYFLYLRSESEKDNRRWLGFLCAEGLEAVHSRSCPVRLKLGSKLEQAIEEAVKIDPSKTNKKISKGIILCISVCWTSPNYHFVGNFSFTIYRCRIAMQPLQYYSGYFEFLHPSQLRKKG